MIEPYLKFLRPLLSQVADNTDASWWLLDSGASTSVLVESNLSAFRSVLQDSEGLGGYRAANGSSVNMSGTAEIGVQMHMSGTSGDDWCWKKARLNVLVGSIRHNILSITSLADSGWRFTQGPKGFDLFHEKLGMHCLDVAYFANCPWVRLYPDVGSSSAYRSDLTVSNTHDFSVAAVSGGDDMNWHVTGDRDIFHSIRIAWSVPKVVPSFSTEETKVTGKRFQFRLILHFSTQQVRSLQTNFQVL